MKTKFDLTGQVFGAWSVVERVYIKENQAWWLVRCKCGTEKKLSSHYIRHVWSYKDCGCSKSLVGMKFGRLTVIERLNVKKRVTGNYKCSCECGKVIVTRGNYLLYNRQISCGCYKRGKTAQERGPIQLRGYYMQHARKRNLQFHLSKNDFKDLVNSNCYYCGSSPMTPMQITYKSQIRKNSVFLYNGVDRINNKKGYLKENSVPCCGKCNLMKRDLDVNEWIEHMGKILDNFGKSLQLAETIKMINTPETQTINQPT